MIEKLKRFFLKPIFSDQRFILGLWVLAAFIVPLHLFTLGPGAYNNYLIFKHVFYHTIEQTNLYATYPDLYFDNNHYGPIFSIVIAPFALLPDYAGVILWAVVVAIALFYAIKSLPMDWLPRVAILYICWHEMTTAASSLQSNALIAALIIWSFVSVNKGKDFYAGFFIALGFFIKLYGIVGLSFFFFSKNKIKFIAGLLFWSGVMFVLPMLISSPDFIIQSYTDWFDVLTSKNSLNAVSMHQDISVMGMFRRITGHKELSNLLFIAPAIILFALQYLKTNLYSNISYRLAILASTLLFVVLFSSGSESSGYIIAMVGVGVWFMLQPRPFSIYVIALLVFVMVLTSFSPSDLFPAYLRKNYVIPYALKALPCFIVWLTLIYQIYTAKNNSQNIFV